jgi:Ni/Co efflux regulator RcnB
MKSFVATVTALGLLTASTAALAQEDHNRPEQGARPAGGQPPGRPSGPQGAGAHAGPAERSAGAQGPGRSAGEQNPSRAPAQPGDRGGRGPGQQPAGHAPGPTTPRTDRSVDQGARQAGHNPPSAAQGPGVGANRPGSASHAAPPAGARATARSPNVTALRGNIQAPRHFSAGAYRPPQGYSYRRWSYGDRLPPAYFGRSYWLTNYLAYALFAPPPGLVWIRVGPDALLIDQYSGEVVRAEYGVFY